mgnify:CR=1 FL=1
MDLFYGNSPALSTKNGVSSWIHRFWETYRKELEKAIERLDHNGICQCIVDIVAAVFDRDSTVIFLFGNHSDGFTAVTAQGEQERLQSRVSGVDAGNDIFLAAACIQ